MTILYTPAGDTDPIRAGHDGAILHIIRKYHPRMVRIFLSKDMTAKEEQRQVYSKAIKYNAPDCEIGFTKTDIIEVQLMENLIPLAEEFLQLRKEYPNEKIILNLSSGTPQMKSIMSFLATDFENVIPVQVDSPSRGSNRAAYATQDDDDIDEIIKTNEDNNENREDRCHEAPLSLLRRYNIRHQLISLIENYEYSAAYALYNKNSAMFTDVTGQLIKHADLRAKLQTEKAFTVGKDLVDKQVSKNERINMLYEFFMVMWLRQKKGDLAEFVVKLTPFLFELLLYYFETQTDLKPARFCTKKDNINASWKISREMLADVSPDTLLYLDTMGKGNFRDGTNLSFYNMLKILHALNEKAPKDKLTVLLNLLDELRLVEDNHRNGLAHTITNITEESLTAIAPYKTSDEIMGLVSNVFMKITAKEKLNISNLYDNLNIRIIASLEEFRK